MKFTYISNTNRLRHRFQNTLKEYCTKSGINWICSLIADIVLEI